MHVGLPDQKLVNYKLENNANQVNQNRAATHWASTLPMPIFLHLLAESYERLNDNNLAIKGNDMELFHFLSAGPHVLNYAPTKLLQNLNDITDLILNKKFLPFPARPKKDGRIMNMERYPPSNGYENYRQLNVIARAIIIHPELVGMWKKIGYHEICSDLNDLVIQPQQALIYLKIDQELVIF